MDGQRANDDELWFSGEWELEAGGAGYYTAYQALSFDHPWNRWATPVVTASVMARLVWRQNELCTRFAEAGVDDWTRMTMHDNSVVVFSGITPTSRPFESTPTPTACITWSISVGPSSRSTGLRRCTRSATIPIRGVT